MRLRNVDGELISTVILALRGTFKSAGQDQWLRAAMSLEYLQIISNGAPELKSTIKVHWRRAL